MPFGRSAIVVAAVMHAGFGATDASAATVSVTLDAELQSSNEVRYVAGPGEANDLTADYAPDARSVTVTDPGAAITALGSCTSLTEHAAVCTAPDPLFPNTGPHLQSVRALLGDMNDRAVTTRSTPYPIGGLDAFGGAGDDVLDGSPTEDLLDGGSGRDVLSGGAGIDTLSYKGRARGVVVDLASGQPAGAPGEGDLVTGVESILGGRGDDRLAGDDGYNVIDGGRGENRLSGRGGDDWLVNASGAAVRCGRGADSVSGTRARTSVSAGCDHLSIALPASADEVEAGASIRPTPRLERGQLGFDLRCPDIDGTPANCGLTLRLRTRSGGLLAVGRLDDAQERGGTFVSLELTDLGRRWQEDSRRQLARVVLSGTLMTRTAWSITF